MAKIIYIAGLGHSGSTLLDMSLGTLKNVVGLGELKTLLEAEDRKRHYQSTCSCGNPAKDCNWWKDFPSLVQGEVEENQKIENTIIGFTEKYGADAVMVDSSKNSNKYLSYLYDNHDLRVIFLTRDIRSWSVSRYLSTGQPVVYYFLRWILENVKLRNRIKRMGIKPFYVGYEELSLYPEFILKKICNHCDLEYSESMLTPDKTKSHIISGNVARVDSEKRSGWHYDPRWMTSFRILALSPFLLLFHRQNMKYVYGNLRNLSGEDFHVFGIKRKREMNEKYN